MKNYKNITQRNLNFNLNDGKGNFTDVSIAPGEVSNIDETNEHVKSLAAQKIIEEVLTTVVTTTQPNK